MSSPSSSGDEGSSTAPSAGRVAHRHRQELRDLERRAKAETGRVKKNKQRKAEVAAEWEARRTEMLARHERELAEASGAAAAGDDDDDDGDGDDDDPAGHVTGAGDDRGTAEAEAMLEQMRLGAGGVDAAAGDSGGGDQRQRRQKKKNKAAARRERREAEQRAEEDAIRASLAGRPSARDVEDAAVEERLRARGLQLLGVRADGNCLFAAVDAALKAAGHAGGGRGVPEQRRAAARYMREHAEELRPFVVDADGMSLSPEAFAAHVADVETRPEAWGGEPELLALSRVHGTPVRVVSAAGEHVVGGDRAGITVTFHSHQYALGAHYNAAVPEA